MLAGFAAPVAAQTPVLYPTYIVQSGDTLTSIALRFSISVDQLVAANNLTNPNALVVGARLIIPGLEGVSGILLTKAVPIGETLNTLAVKNQLSRAMLLKLNKYTSPEELFAGANLILPEGNANIGVSAKQNLREGQSFLEAAVQSNTTKWNITLLNQDAQLGQALPGDVVFYYTGKSSASVEISSISPLVKKLQVSPLPLAQGKTITVRISTSQSVSLTGSLAGNPLKFIRESENLYVALQGVHALAEAGLTPLNLIITDAKGVSSKYDENLLIRAGGYIKDPPLTVDPNTIDPATTKPEEDLVREIYQNVTLQKQWSGKFRQPVDDPVCLQSTYGNRRSYNGSPFNSFHSGVDFGVCKNLNIYAPANGIVVFAGPLTVRGNATIIDHGWGIYSGYWHQSQIKVKLGDQVKAGQLIGLVGATGRVTGPHLHWEVVVNGVQVEPLDWLEQSYP